MNQLTAVQCTIAGKQSRGIDELGKIFWIKISAGKAFLLLFNYVFTSFPRPQSPVGMHLHHYKNFSFSLVGMSTHRGHSITTWTIFWPFLTTYLPQVDNRRHFRYHLPTVHVDTSKFYTPSGAIWQYVPHFSHFG